MAAVVVVGAQWGDEAKGKVVDLLAERADVVVRYAGGSNAGHTVAVGDMVLKLHLIPSGILNAGACCVISDGVVVDPTVLLREIAELREKGIPTGNLKVSPNAHVVLPYHKEIDRLEEERKGTGKIGTTMQGVGPAYEDKARRCGIRVGDLVEAERLRERLEAVLPDKNFLLTQFYRSSALDEEAIIEEYSAYGRRLKPFVDDTARIVYHAVQRDERVLFEGAQGTMLDIDYGTYPYVTSSHPVAGGACLGTGVGPKAIDTVIGVCKAYTTRVGEGAFPTEQDNEIGQYIRERGNEYGTTTGRPRRVGWIDVVGLRYTAQVNGLDFLAVTVLDVLGGLPEVRICTGYRCQGQVLEDFPVDRRILSEVEPVYDVIPGWTEDISRVTRYADLPRQVKEYVGQLQRLVGVPVALLGVGKRRDQTILLEKDLFSAGRQRKPVPA